MSWAASAHLLSESLWPGDPQSCQGQHFSVYFKIETFIIYLGTEMWQIDARLVNMGALDDVFIYHWLSVNLQCLDYDNCARTEGPRSFRSFYKSGKRQRRIVEKFLAIRKRKMLWEISELTNFYLTMRTKIFLFFVFFFKGMISKVYYTSKFSIVFVKLMRCIYI